MSERCELCHASNIYCEATSVRTEKGWVNGRKVVVEGAAVEGGNLEFVSTKPIEACLVKTGSVQESDYIPDLIADARKTKLGQRTRRVISLRPHSLFRR